MLQMRTAFRQCLQRTLKREDIHVTFEMLQVLHCLWHQPGATQQALAERTLKSKASLSSLMNTLEKRGYVERRAELSDRRNKRVFLSPEGERIWRKILPILNGLYARFEERFGPDLLCSMSSNLMRMHDELEKM